MLRFHKWWTQLTSAELVIFGLNSAAFFTLLCAKVFVVLYQHIPKKVSSFWSIWQDLAHMCRLQSICTIHMAGQLIIIVAKCHFQTVLPTDLWRGSRYGRVVAGPKWGHYEPKQQEFFISQVSPKLSRRHSWAQLCCIFHLAMCEGLCSAVPAHTQESKFILIHMAGSSTYVQTSKHLHHPYGRTVNYYSGKMPLSDCTSTFPWVQLDQKGAETVTWSKRKGEISAIEVLFVFVPSNMVVD